MTKETINFDTHEDFNLSWELNFTYQGEKYVAKLADGLASAKYRDAQINGSIFRQSSKEVAIGSIGSVENVLVGYCVFNEKGKRVGPKVVEGWHFPVISKLYDEIRENSHLNDPEDEEDIEVLKEQIKDLQSKVDGVEEDSLGNSLHATMFGNDSADT